ncbi:HTTM domain-containing protein [Natronorubrum thiooxidans]|uniref:Vitamin K-dependent gamma-carboxylase n=1 Tax=Natronorubrum thiooxidans TaxID=308853 RepID=A0A1N7FU47_9EURY|nr:HTTM domain-containing protein [Natronorubrum thiooxidans]SIS03777.1 Vitamin K-dependent gamma-carboxylase [Natronorubrum thiooxidans]
MTCPPTDRTSAQQRRSRGVASFRAALESRLGIDQRALGAFRIALGLLLLADLAMLRLPGLVTFYTDAGVFPRSTLLEAYPTVGQVSIHALSGAAWFQAVLFAIAGGFALLLLVGYRTRLATLGSLVLFASLHARNPHLANGGDTILLSFLLFGLFLPLEARWSLEARRHPDRRGRRVCSIATAAILVHFVAIYVTNAVLKFQSEPWMDGTAVQQIFQLKQYLTLLGPALSAYPTVLAATNWLWIAVLTASALLLVVTGQRRIALVAAFVATHLGMAATMRLGVFPFVMIAGLLLFLPSGIWDRLERLGSAFGLEKRFGARSAIGGDDAPANTVAGDDAPSRLRRGGRLVASGLVACLLVSSLLWQAAGIGVVDTPAIDGELDDAGWTFFAPNPPSAHSWYAVDGMLESGETVDVANARLDRPPTAAETYPSTLWKRYGMDLRYAGETQYESAAASLCERTDREVDSLTISLVEQPVGPDGPVGEPTVHERLEYDC